MSKYSGLGLDKSQPKLLGLYYYFNIFLGKKNATHLQDGGGFESLLKTAPQQKTLKGYYCCYVKMHKENC